MSGIRAKETDNDLGTEPQTVPMMRNDQKTKSTFTPSRSSYF